MMKGVLVTAEWNAVAGTPFSWKQTTQEGAYKSKKYLSKNNWIPTIWKEDIMPSIKCKDLGMDCGFKATAETEEELLKMVAAHAAEVHGMKEISPEVMEKVKAAIKE